MVVIRFPNRGLTSEYGDIILFGVTERVSLKITYNAVVILEEDYFPDADNVVTIRDVGKLAALYIDNNDLSLTEGVDGKSIKMTIEIIEHRTPEQNSTDEVTFFRSNIDFAGSISTTLIQKMPLSRTNTKVTGPGRKEFVSFYANAVIAVYAVYSNGVKDVASTVTPFTTLADNSNLYRIDVSPSVVAAAVGCSESQLIYYNVYGDDDTIIRYRMDHRNHVNKTTFFFRNCFGAQETFTCVGHAERDGGWEREYGVIHNSMIQTSKEKNDQIKVKTGYLIPSMMDVLDDLLNSDLICVLDGTVLRPVVILSEDFTRTTRKNEPRSFEIEYRYASNTPQGKYVQLSKSGVFDETFDPTFE